MSPAEILPQRPAVECRLVRGVCVIVKWHFVRSREKKTVGHLGHGDFCR